MKRYRWIQVLLLLAILPIWNIGGKVSEIAFAAYQDIRNMSPQATITGPVGQPSGDWDLTFNDEFDGTALDQVKWRSDYWNGGNGELQEYVNDDSHNNYIVQNGVLSLVARRESYQGKNYTSGIITTQERFFQRYGFFEIRAKMPYGKGLWPAFWMMPNPTGWPPEIDVVEYLGDQRTTAYMSVHYANPTTSSTTYYTGPDFSAGFHTYGVEWRSDALVWYIDGVERRRFTDAAHIPNVAMFLLANLAVGGSWPGSPDGSTVFPAYYDIDYIRAWQRAAAPAPSATPTSTAIATSTSTPPPAPSDTPTATPTPGPSPTPTDTPTATSTSAPSSTPTATPTAPLDQNPPLVAITSPTDGSVVSRKTTVNITANASDDWGVSKVEFRVNGSLLCTDSSAPYACSWKVPGNNRTTLYTIEARAYDLSGNKASSTVKVTSK